MTAWLRAALILSMLAYAPSLLEQFETPKAAVIRVLGIGLLAAGLAQLLAHRNKQVDNPHPGTRPLPPRAGHGRPSMSEARPLRWYPLDICMLAWLVVEIVSTGTSVSPRISLL